MPLPTFVPFDDIATRRVKATVGAKRPRIGAMLIFFDDGTYTRFEANFDLLDNKPYGQLAALVERIKRYPDEYVIRGELPDI
jgi:hypothetical protein